MAGETILVTRNSASWLLGYAAEARDRYAKEGRAEMQVQAQREIDKLIGQIIAAEEIQRTPPPMDLTATGYGAWQQPEPTWGQGDIGGKVIHDLQERMALGTARYGSRLQAHNGRNALLDAYQECLDQALYLRQALEEWPPVEENTDGR